MKKSLLTVLLTLLCFFAYSLDTLTVGSNLSIILNKRYFTQLEDKNGDRNIDEVIKSTSFHATTTNLPFIRFADSVIWIKFMLHNKTNDPYLPITINSSVIETFDLYSVNGSEVIVHLSSLNIRGKAKGVVQASRVINCPLLPDSVRTIYVRIKTNDSMAIPITVQSADLFLSNNIAENLTIGFFLGIVVIMILYNLMLYFIVGDRSYLFYVFYIIFLGITQALNRGGDAITSQIDKPLLANYLIPLSRIFFWYSILLFVHEFLQLKQNLLKKYSRYYFIL